MSIFKVLDANIKKSAGNFSEYLGDKSGDILKGSEFMLYALSNIFSDKEIEDIERGIVDASYRGELYDFGIDAIFITGSNDFIENPEQLDEYNKDAKFKIHIFQFKKGKGITQADLLKLNSGIKKVVIDEDISDSENLYFSNRMTILNEIRNNLFTNFSSENISVQVHIVFGGIESNVRSEKILVDALAQIEKHLKDNGYTNTKIQITDAQGLINAPSEGEQIVDIIEYQQNFKYITETDPKNKLIGYICIINGRNIAELVRKYQSRIFESNIRDYYKRNDLNSKITETSSSEQEAKYFWSYNNGLTMTCSKVEELPHNKYKLHNLQIVNGCQTSNAIYQAVLNKERVNELIKKRDNSYVQEKELSKNEQADLDSLLNLQFNDATSLLVKIIETDNEDFIYRITETTNSQTPIKAFSLRANDNIQKLIEQYLANNNISYERRINNLRNKGKRNIYSILKLFQLYTAQILIKPSQVKTLPKGMFAQNYDSVFPETEKIIRNYELYLIPIKIDIALTKGIREYLANDPDVTDYRKTLISYGKLHLGCFLLSSIMRADYNDKSIISKITYINRELSNNVNTHLADAINNFEKILKNFAGNRKEAILSAVRKNELDAKISRFIKTRK